MWTHRTWGNSAKPEYPWGAFIYGEKGTLKASVNSWEFEPYGEGKKLVREAVKEFDKYPQDWKEEDLDRFTAVANRQHQRDFLKAIQERSRPVADIEQGHTSTASCILANLSMQLGREITWDAEKQEVADDPDANKLLARPYREPWIHPQPVNAQSNLLSNSNHRGWRPPARPEEPMAVSRLVLLILAATSWAGLVAPACADRPPNLVFLLADDMRYDALGANGNPIVQTPHLDELAERGVCFDCAFVTTSICVISRALFMTGQYARRHGILRFNDELTPSQLRETYFARLKAGGYSIGFVGKWGVGKPPQGLFENDAAYEGQGAYYGPPTDSQTHLTTFLGRQAEEYLARQDGERPFCLSVSFKAPHVDDRNLDRPFNYDRRLASMYAGVAIPEAPLSDPSFFAVPPVPARERE